MINILDRITSYRTKKGWTEYQLAEESGLTQSTISSWLKVAKGSIFFFSLSSFFLFMAFAKTFCMIFMQKMEKEQRLIRSKHSL